MPSLVWDTWEGVQNATYVLSLRSTILKNSISPTDQSWKQSTDPDLARIHHHLLVSVPAPPHILLTFQRRYESDWAEFNIPAPFNSRVRNALKAEARSVRLSNLVGAGGLWYGFGKTIMDILSDEQANEMSEMLAKACTSSSRITTFFITFPQAFSNRLPDVIDQAQHFAALGQAGSGGASANAAQAFREGLDTTEREIFLLAQGTAKRTKRWYQDTERKRT
ncbi:hypothetical protein D9613_005601 [Agrocybe pediades]|uniref:DNA replication complex GINS protein PSF3 n=1 Tax=Agrocybe pediades TaxID=84607 RepID=A0A8H4QYW7_9AGAR|nr:hypothetical protein D9613_005601 [Agrocybe pediades]